jgi:WD40 repeat protein
VKNDGHRISGTQFFGVALTLVQRRAASRFQAHDAVENTLCFAWFDISWPVQAEFDAWTLAYSPDGKILASAGQTAVGQGSCLYLRDAISGKELKVINVRKEPARSTCFSPDSKSIALAGGYSLIAEVWDVATGEKRLAIDYPKKRSDSGLMTVVAFTPDGKTITTASIPNGAIHFFDANTGERTGGVGPGTTLAYSPDGKLLAAGRQGPTIHLWEVATLKQLGTISPIESNMRVISALAFSPDNKTLAVGGVSLSDTDSPIRRWDGCPLCSRRMQEKTD